MAFLLAGVVFAPVSEAANGGLSLWTMDNFQAWVEDRRRQASTAEDGLFPYPNRQGFCPGWGDSITSFYRAYSQECSEAIVFSRYRAGKAAAAALQKCIGASLDDPIKVMKGGDVCKGSPITPQDIAQINGVSIENAKQQFEDLKAQLREDGVRVALAGKLDVTSIWKELAVCTAKAMATSGEMTEGEKSEWRTLVDTVDAVTTDVSDFAAFSESLANLGPIGVAQKKLPQGATGVAAFIEQTKGLGKAMKEFIASRFGILGAGWRTISGVKEGELADEVSAVLDDIDSCRFDKAESDAEIVENKLRARINEMRYRVVLAEKALLCRARDLKIFKSGQSAYSPNDRSAFLEGWTLPHNARPVRVSEFLDWEDKLRAHDTLIAAYQKLKVRSDPTVMSRRRAAYDALESQLDERILPLLDTALKQIAACGDTDRSGVTPSLETLQRRLVSERDDLQANRCGTRLMTRFGSLLNQGIREVEVADRTRKLSDGFLGEAERDIRLTLSQCGIGQAFDRWSQVAGELQRGAQLAGDEPEVCYFDRLDALKTGIENRAKALGALARQADMAIAAARIAYSACEPSRVTSQSKLARDTLARAACPAAMGVRRRLDSLKELEATEPEACRPTAEEADKAYVVITISGAGYVPHWAGGSWAVQGADDDIITLSRGESLSERVAVLKKQLKGDPCEARSPSVSGAHRPWFWIGEPDVGIKQYPVATLAEVDRAVMIDNWEVKHDKGPNLSDLKKQWGCGI